MRHQYRGHFITLLAVGSLAIASVYFGGAAGCNNTNAAGGGPEVSSTNPVNAATGVAINRKIAATFSEEMDPLTITTTTFQVTGPGSTSVAGTVDMDSKNHIAIFSPAANLASNTVFTATITTGVEALVGDGLASDYEWTFTTGTTTDDTAPTITSTNPANADTDVAINRNIAATFNEAMDPATITTATFTLKQGATPVSGTVTSLGNVATFAPGSNLAPNTTFTATITTGAEDLAGNALAANKVWSFKTGTATAAGPEPVVLGTAGNFVILAKSGISTTGTTSVVGDIGVSPAAASFITGFGLSAPPTTFTTSSLVTGKVYAADYDPPTPANMTTAVSDMETAFTDAAGRTLPDATELGAGEIGGLTLVPGLYKWGTDVLISTDVTLSGGANDVWIFQIAQNLNLADAKKVTLAGGAQAKNIFWQVAGQATLGTTSNFKGIILCQTAIVLNTGASLNGRALAQTAVTLDANAVTKP